MTGSHHFHSADPSGQSKVGHVRREETSWSSWKHPGLVRDLELVLLVGMALQVLLLVAFFSQQLRFQFPPPVTSCVHKIMFGSFYKDGSVYHKQCGVFLAAEVGEKDKQFLFDCLKPD